ncbi:DUF4129 domain-containing protein [Mucilaginibacter litoreus]|uniref:DUF4129 domain-containing protein n=1 Tax=Mucilaginibacter litoreus TaxID=1048221 RepID=A0ABW3AVR7_9SPHI
MSRLLFIVVFLFTCCICFAAPDTLVKKKPAILRQDSSLVNVRHFDTTALAQYKKLPEFTYNDSYEGPSLWTRFWRWFWSLFDFKKLNASRHPTFWTWFFIILKYAIITGGAAALVFLILKLAGLDVNVFRRKPKASLEYSEQAENIHEIDFENDISNAVSTGNYRLAVRLLYLKSLKQLSDNGLINWQINKTNTHYVNELTDPALRDTFKTLTYQFEYIWYGDFNINKDIYNRISNLFNSFKGGRA